MMATTPAVIEARERIQKDSRAFGPNVEKVRTQSTCVIRGRLFASVRRELMAGVKAGVLGRLKKDGLKPEVFFHPDHLHGARDRQNREAAYSVSCIAKVIAPADPAGILDPWG